MRKLKHHMLAKLVCVFFVLNLVGCGTILYPERKGQSGGRLDPAVVILDAVGLLFYFIPGAVAFAIDFANGTIYLPGGHASKLSPEELKSISENGKLDEEAMEKISQLVKQKSSQPLFFDARDLQVRPVKEHESVIALVNDINRFAAK